MPDTADLWLFLISQLPDQFPGWFFFNPLLTPFPGSRLFCPLNQFEFKRRLQFVCLLFHTSPCLSLALEQQSTHAVLNYLVFNHGLATLFPTPSPLFFRFSDLPPPKGNPND